jgi:TP901 family phage tail tape measure protein
VADRKVTIILAGSAAGAVRAFEETAAAADASSKTVGDKFAAAGERTGGIFSKLGQTLGNWGLPFGESVSRIGDRFSEVDAQGQKFSAAMSEVGKVSLLAGAAGMAAAAVESIHLATNFQSSMELIRTQAGASQAEVDKMSKAVLSLAGPTATAPLELSAALYHIESTGMRGAAALQELKIAAEGAKVGHADLESVTNALNATMASGIKGTSTMSAAMGSLNTIVGAGDMRMSDLADAMGTGVLAVVKGFGVSLDDAGAALATFGDNNIRGADAATQLRMAVEMMAVPPATAAKALGQLNMTTKQLADDLRSGGLDKAVTDLHAHLVATGHDGASAGAILTEAFGKKAGPGIAILTDQFTRFQSKIEEVKGGASGFGAAFTATTHTLSFQMDQAKATLEALGTSFGMFLIPKLEEAGHAVEDVIGFFQQHKAAAEALAAVIATVLGGAIATFAIEKAVAFGSAVKDMATGMVQLAAKVLTSAGIMDGAFAAEAAAAETSGAATTTAFGPIGLAIAAIGIAAFELVKHWHTVWADIKAVALDAWHFIDDILHNKFVQVIIGIEEPVLLLALHWHTVWEDIKAVVEDVWKFLKPIFDAIGGGISKITGAIGGIAKVGGGIVKGIAGMFEAGGMVPGSGPQLAIVHGGELVIDAASTSRLTAGSPGGPSVPSVMALAMGVGGPGSGSGPSAASLDRTNQLLEAILSGVGQTADAAGRFASGAASVAGGVVEANNNQLARQMAGSV